MTFGIGEGIALIATVAFLLGYSLSTVLDTMNTVYWKPHVLDIVMIPVLILLGIVVAPWSILVLSAKFMLKAAKAVKSLFNEDLHESNDKLQRKTDGVHPKSSKAP